MGAPETSETFCFLQAPIPRTMTGNASAYQMSRKGHQDMTGNGLPSNGLTGYYLANQMHPLMHRYLASQMNL